MLLVYFVIKLNRIFILSLMNVIIPFHCLKLLDALKKFCLFVCLVFFRPTRINFSCKETSPLPAKDCKV